MHQPTVWAEGLCLNYQRKEGKRLLFISGVTKLHKILFIFLWNRPVFFLIIWEKLQLILRLSLPKRKYMILDREQRETKDHWRKYIKMFSSSTSNGAGRLQGRSSDLSPFDLNLPMGLMCRDQPYNQKQGLIAMSETTFATLVWARIHKLVTPTPTCTTYVNLRWIECMGSSERERSAWRALKVNHNENKILHFLICKLLVPKYIKY